MHDIYQIVHAIAVCFHQRMIFYCMEILQCLYPFIINEHLGSFKLWGIMNKAAMGILVYVFLPMYIF